MKNIERKILQNREFYKNYPEVYKYFTDNKECIVCHHNVNKEMNAAKKDNSTNSTTNFQSNKKTEPIIRSKEEIQLDADFLIWIKKLGIAHIDMGSDQVLKPIIGSDKCNNPIKAYCDFLSCIDLESPLTSIKKFDLNCFSLAFKFNFGDRIFLEFIDRLIKDPVVYEKHNKVKFLNIEIFSYSFMNKNKIDSKLLRKRIEEHAFLFKPDPNYDVELTNDILVDKMILQLHKNTFDLRQAIFMNQAYLNVSKDKEYFELFHKTLVESIKGIDRAFLLSFLKHVFTFRTVLFTCIQEDQLIRLVLSFYKNMNRSDYTISLLLALYSSLKSDTSNAIIFDTLKTLCLNSKKHNKTLKLLEIRQIINLCQFKEFVSNNSESFDALNLIFTQIRQISAFAENIDHRISLAEACIHMFITIKSEFLDRFLSALVNIVSDVLDKIECIDKISKFNLDHWDALSNMVLACQKDNTEEKKKKCSTNFKQSEKYKLGLKLAKLLYSCEDKLSKNGIENFVQLKKRGFKIESKE